MTKTPVCGFTMKLLRNTLKALYGEVKVLEGMTDAVVVNFSRTSAVLG